MILGYLNKRLSIVAKLIFVQIAILLTALTLWGYVSINLLAEGSPSHMRIVDYYVRLAIFTVVLLAVATVVVYLLMHYIFVRPIRRMISGAAQLANGRDESMPVLDTSDEIGRLARAIRRMGRDMRHKEQELNKRKDEYQKLFELVPCIISLQDRSYRLIGYNREFSEHFDPTIGDYCYHAYKGRERKCDNCPVEKTFTDGLPHYSEETGLNKDGSANHWIVKTAAMRDDDGEIIGAMEMSLDITHRKELENRLAQSEKKYYAIFNNIPNPVFVLDAETLAILDCNGSVGMVYGYCAEELLGLPFSDLFPEQERQRHGGAVRRCEDIPRARHLNKRGEPFFVQIQLSPAEYEDRRVLLATVGDITDRLEAERQLPVEEAVEIAKAVANALDFAHRKGVVHRDIKPGNVLFQDGEPVVSDFGIALAVGAGSAARPTETGLSVGTPYHMSPEQATGDQQVGPRSDIYSLGCVLYEMLIGNPPYMGNTAQAVLGQIITAKPPLATEHRPSVPAHLEAALRKALEKLPQTGSAGPETSPTPWMTAPGLAERPLPGPWPRRKRTSGHRPRCPRSRLRQTISATTLPTYHQQFRRWSNDARTGPYSGMGSPFPGEGDSGRGPVRGGRGPLP